MKICLACQREYEDPTLGACPADSRPLHPLLESYSDDATQLEGHVVGDRYVIERLLGKGGHGIVVKAQHVFLQRPVALKLLHPALLVVEEVRARFLREARVASRVSCPQVVEIIDFGVTRSRLHYLVMEYLEGQDLRHYLRERGAQDLRRVCGIAVQLCDALEAIHAAGFVHRDLKPGNVWVLPESRGDIPQVKLLDFGIAGVLGEGEGEGERITASGAAIGTPQYMAPEQIQSGPVDARTDVYALGCLLWEMAVGKNRVQGKGAMDVFTKQLLQPARAPSLERPGLPGWFDALVLDCLAKDAADRPASASELKLLLEHALRRSEREPALLDAPELADTQATPVPSLDTLTGPPAALLAEVDDDAQETGQPGSQVSLPAPVESARARWPLLVAALLLIVAGVVVAAWPGDAPEAAEARTADTSGTPLAAPPTEREEAATQDKPAVEVDEPSPTEPPTEAPAPAPAKAPAPARDVDLGSPDAGVRGEADAVAPAPAPEVHRVVVKSVPERAVLKRGQERLGRAPQTIEWSEGEEAPELTVISPWGRRTIALEPGQSEVTVRFKKPRRTEPKSRAADEAADKSPEDTPPKKEDPKPRFAPIDER